MTKPSFSHFKEIFADGEYSFDLNIDRVREFEEKFNKSAYAMMVNMTRGHWNVGDVIEVVRLALIGGGTKPIDALRLVRDYVEKRPLTENTALAVRCLEAFYFGLDKPIAEQIAEVEPALDVIRDKVAAR